jgi:hypothetical protein
LNEHTSDFEMLAPVELSIFCFRYMPPDVNSAYATASPPQRKVIIKRVDELSIKPVHRKTIYCIAERLSPLVKRLIHSNL